MRVAVRQSGSLPDELYAEDWVQKRSARHWPKKLDSPWTKVWSKVTSSDFLTILTFKTFFNLRHYEVYRREHEGYRLRVCGNEDLKCLYLFQDYSRIKVAVRDLLTVNQWFGNRFRLLKQLLVSLLIMSAEMHCNAGPSGSFTTRHKPKKRLVSSSSNVSTSSDWSVNENEREWRKQILSVFQAESRNRLWLLTHLINNTEGEKRCVRFDWTRSLLLLEVQWRFVAGSALLKSSDEEALA